MTSPHPEVVRISVRETREKLISGAPTLLVCIYPQAAWDRSHLEGSISMAELVSRLPGLSREQEIVFY